MSRHRVLIIDQRTSYPIQLCRALARAGHEVHGVAEAGAALLRSRWCHHRIPTAPWYADRAYFETVNGIVEAGGFDVIYVCGEVVLEQLQPFFRLGGAWTAFPFDTSRLASAVFDKNAAIARVAAAGVPVPRNLVPATEDDVPGLAADLGFPLVVKGEKGGAAQNVRIVHDPGDLLPRYREVRDNERGYAGKPALQEFIPGPTYLVGGVFRDGEALRIAAYRKAVMYPANGGATVKGVSERPPALIANALSAFRALNYTGLGSLDFLLDERDGQFKFLEINPRPWATIGLGLACTDLLGPYHALATRGKVEPDLTFREGVRWHRLSGEIQLIRERPSRLPGFLLDCLDPRVASDFDWADVLAALRARCGGWLAAREHPASDRGSVSASGSAAR